MSSDEICPSGNDKIDKLIQDAQLNANHHREFSDVIEWIPYDRFKDVKQIDIENQQWEIYHKEREVALKMFDNFFSDVIEWIPYDRFKDVKQIDIENQQWEIYHKEREVALKMFDNFVNFNDMEIHLKIQIEAVSIRFYGITQDPETHSYMMILQYAKDGNLREYLKINFNNINWEQKLDNLYALSSRLMDIYELDIVHQDFHPGNILSPNFKQFIRISDFGLSKQIGANPNNPEKKNIFGILPYIAPEVLIGDEEYTKAADVYSFGIIAYKIVTSFPLYPDILHNKDLAIKICNRLRPKIPFHIPKLITRIIMRCWDARLSQSQISFVDMYTRVTHKLTFKELREELWKYYYDYKNNKDSKIRIQIENPEKLSKNLGLTNSTTPTPHNYQTHPQAIYTS
ncbi:hypothetical protein Glove_275g102 [Diversispora epigaea]|uniref:Protein kinase domain-containing protein n=1 Tax=Diversispora epigaea TaxID=1348612 RepID=A0A397I3B5_9GLOM|nr:hypothetical protein Glove_275g102 [Diversispora epigaea]